MVASQWVSDHKAEIAITVGVVALVAATVLTGGAALAVAGAVAGGAAVSAGTVATVVAGGVVAGAGLNLAQQGAQIKDGVVDPATGKKKTDIAWGDVAKSGAMGGVMAPVGAAAFGLAPVAVGALGVLGVGQGVKSGVENVQQGHNWSAALDFGTAAMAAAPFATKGGRNAMFGAEARARTAQTATQAWNGGKNLGAQTWNGAKGLGTEGLNGVKNLSSQAWNGTKNLGSQAWGGVKNFGAQAWSGTKNFGAQAWSGIKNGALRLEERANQVIDRTPVLNELFPRGGNGGNGGLQPAYAGAGEQRGTTPRTIENPKQQPLRMEVNNSERPQVASTPGKELPQRSSDLKWPPDPPQGPKPKLGGEGAADWRYQRYLKSQYQKGKTAEQVLPKDKWTELHYNPAERGDRPGRMGGSQQVAAKEVLNSEGIKIVENVEVGGRFPDGVSPKPNTQGGKDYYEVGTMLKKGIPQSRERVKIEDELKALGKNDSVTFVDKNDPSKRITYKKGDSTDSKTLEPDP